PSPVLGGASVTGPEGRKTTGRAAPVTTPAIGDARVGSAGTAVGAGVGVGKVQTTLTATDLLRPPALTVICACPGLSGAVKMAVALPPLVMRSGVIVPIVVVNVAVVPLSTWRPALSVMRAMICAVLPQGTPAAGTRKFTWAATPGTGVGLAPRAVEG